MHRLFVREALKRQRNFSLAASVQCAQMALPGGSMLQNHAGTMLQKLLTIALPAVASK
jgi:hypothetical protein